MGLGPGASGIRRSRSPWAHLAPTFALLFISIIPVSADDAPSDTTATAQNQDTENDG